MRTVLVTGSSRGLGKAMALAFADQKHHIAIHYVSSATPAEEMVKELSAQGIKASAFQADVSNPEACQNLVKAVNDSLGSIDILINNAGITKDGLAMRMKQDQWQSIIDTNLSSAFYVSKAALRSMVSQKWGRIINISSVVALMGNIGQVNYVSAKAGLIGMTKALAQEYGERGITVNAIAPGFIDSDMTAKLPEELKTAYFSRILPNAGKPEEVAALAYFLASDQASYITGQTIAVDGGMVMH
ncbi:MAG: 3-oxoacyl-[acyl-carrier-protein] reductase [Deinococcales bacterium]